MEFISIIIPAYNSERWLARCIDSVIEAADVECEIVVVDDGSNDSTPEIIKDYTSRDPRITMVKTDHVGPCAARLTGFKESTGDYVMFVDSDDTLPSDSIAILRQLLREPSADDLLADATRDERRLADETPHLIIANIISRSEHGDQLLISGRRRALTGSELIDDILEGKMPRFLVGHLFSRELIGAIEWDSNPSIKQLEHVYMMLSMAKKLEEWHHDGRGEHLVVVDPTRNVYNYLLRPGSQSSMMSPTHDGFEVIWDHLTKLGLPEPQLTLWGLRILRDAFIHRGIPFENTFTMATDLRERASRLGHLPEDLDEILDSLSSKKKRLQIGRRLARTAALTNVAPHITFIVPSRGAVKKVRRTIKSIFDTGFRNIEVILVDTNENYRTSVALSEINVAYPRVRIVKTAPGAPVIQANFAGLIAARGLAVMFIRPGDRINGEGAYHALVHIDQGADLVLVNIRRFSPITRRLGKSESNVGRIKEPISEKTNYADEIRHNLENGHYNKTPRLRANLWRREMLLQAEIPSIKFDELPVDKIAGETMKHILNKNIKVIVQRPDALPAYDIALTGGSIADHFNPTGKGASTEHFFRNYVPTDSSVH